MFDYSQFTFSKSKMKYSQHFNSNLVNLLLILDDDVNTLEKLYDLTIEVENDDEDLTFGYGTIHFIGPEGNIIKCLLHMRKIYPQHFYDKFNTPKQLVSSNNRRIYMKNYIDAYSPSCYCYSYCN